MKPRTVIVGAAVAAGILGLGYRMGRAGAAGVPQTGALAYSGTLLSFGQPDNSAHNITVNLWVGSTVSCTTTPAAATQLVNGRFTIVLSSLCTAVIHANPNVDVEVVVDGTSIGKTPLAAAPYALEADTASNPAPGSQLGMLDPTGTVIAFAGTVGGANSLAPPPGWLLCDGSAVSRAQYATLFSVIGTTAGGGDGSTTFNLPDYQGYFLRGLDNGTGRDPDAASRGPMSSGGNTGNAVGSVEGSVFGSHTHGVSDPGHLHGTGTNSSFLVWNHGTVAGDIGVIPTSGGSPAVDGLGNMATATTGVTVIAAGGSETRPLNAAVNYLIKY